MAFDPLSASTSALPTSSISSPPATPAKGGHSRISSRPPPFQRPPQQQSQSQGVPRPFIQTQSLPNVLHNADHVGGVTSSMSLRHDDGSADQSQPHQHHQQAYSILFQNDGSSRSPMAPRPPLPGQAPRPVSPMTYNNAQQVHSNQSTSTGLPGPSSPNAWASSPPNSNQVLPPTMSNNTLPPPALDGFHSPKHSPGLPRSPIAESTRPINKAFDPEVLPPQAVQTAPKERPPPVVRVRVQGIDRAKKELGIKMDASTNISTYHRPQISTFTRTYAEFSALHAALSANHPETILPAMPLPQTSAVNQDDEDRYLRNIFQRFMDRVCRDKWLVMDDELRGFIESDFGYTPLTRAKKLKGNTGFLSRSSKPTPLDEQDFLVVGKVQSAALEAALGDVAKALEKDIKADVAAATAYADLRTNLASFATTESFPPLAKGMQDLSEVMQQMAELQVGQSNASALVLGDALAYEMAEARSAKDAMLQRQYNIDELANSIKATINKRRNIEKMKGSSSIKNEKVSEALEDLEEAEKLEQSLTNRVQAISTNLRPALQTHIRTMNEDILNTLLANARTQLAYEQRRLQYANGIVDRIRKISDRRSAGVYVHPASPAGNTSTPASPVKANSVRSTNINVPVEAPVVTRAPSQDTSALSRFAAREAEIKAQMAASQTLHRGSHAVSAAPKQSAPASQPQNQATTINGGKVRSPADLASHMAQSMYVGNAPRQAPAGTAPGSSEPPRNPLGTDVQNAGSTQSAQPSQRPAQANATSQHDPLAASNGMAQSVILPGRSANLSGSASAPSARIPAFNAADERKRQNARKAASLLAGAL